MNNDQSFLGGLAPANNGGTSNNGMNTGSVIPGAGLMPVGGPTGSPAPAPAPTPAVSPETTPATMSPVGPTPIVPTPIIAEPEPSPVIPSVVSTSDNNNILTPPAIPSVVDASNTSTVAPSIMPSEQVAPNAGIGIMGGNDASSSSVPNNDILGMGVNNPAPVDNNVNINNGPDLMAGGSSPFDIGLGPATMTPNMGSNSIMPSNNANIVGNSTDNKPFTNETANISVEGETVVSVGTYLINMFLFALPVIGFILILVKAFSKKTNKNLSNFAKAFLVMYFLAVVLGVAFMVVAVSIGGFSMNS